MIVTSDIDSSYEEAPEVRIFVQPLDLLPPPPDHVEEGRDALAPEYIDPLAGLPTLGRDGRTLYVRPVEALAEGKDLSKLETDDGLFEAKSSTGEQHRRAACAPTPLRVYDDGEGLDKFAEVKGRRLHTEQDCTFWRFDIEVELGVEQQRIAYRINNGPATAFWVPAKDQTMNMMFYSCNGFTLGTNPHEYSGPDPMWRDMLNMHQTQPFHAMIGGGGQLYNDSILKDAKTPIFQEWLAMKNSLHKHHMPFMKPLQDELECFYLNRYCTWFSQGLYGFANAQIPMVNMYTDHDIIDGFGSFPDHIMASPVISGLGEVAFRYYMLFQHQSVVEEPEDEDGEAEPSWILGARPGPYIKQPSRNLVMSMGKDVMFLGLDCRTERTSTQIIAPETMEKVLDRCEEAVTKGVTKHLLVLLGSPIAFPRTSTGQDSLSSRLTHSVKTAGKGGVFGQFFNKFDGRVCETDDLEDDWTARVHEKERLHIIQDLQDLAAGKSVRIIILSGEARLAAVGRFVSNYTFNIPKDRDYRYMPNIICSAIVNSPPTDTTRQAVSKRSTIRHLDDETDEDLIPLFAHDVNGQPSHDTRVTARRNWCSIRAYDLSKNPYPNVSSDPCSSPPATRALLRRFSLRKRRHDTTDAGSATPDRLLRSFSVTRSQQSSGPDLGRPRVARSLSLSSYLRRRAKPRTDDDKTGGYDSDSEDDTGRNKHERPPPSNVPQRHTENRSESYFSRHKVESSNQPRSPAGNMTRTDIARSFQMDSSVANDQRPKSGLSQPEMSAHSLLDSPSHSWSLDSEEQDEARQNSSPRYHLGTDRGRQEHISANDEINLKWGLEICLNVEVSQRDPAGITVPYRLLVPALFHGTSGGGQSANAVMRTTSSEVESIGGKPAQAVHGGVLGRNVQSAARAQTDHPANNYGRSKSPSPTFAPSTAREQYSGISKHVKGLFGQHNERDPISQEGHHSPGVGSPINENDRDVTTHQQPSHFQGMSRSDRVGNDVKSLDEDIPRRFGKRRVSFAEEQAQRRGGFKRLIGI